MDINQHSACNLIIQEQLSKYKNISPFLGKYGALQLVLNEAVGAGAIATRTSDDLGNVAVRIYYDKANCNNGVNTNFCAGESLISRSFFDVNWNLEEAFDTIQLDYDEYAQICGGTNQTLTQLLMSRLYSKLPVFLSSLNNKILAILHANAGSWSGGIATKIYAFTNPVTGQFQATELTKFSWDLAQLGISTPLGIAGYAAHSLNQAKSYVRSADFSGVDARSLANIQVYEDTQIDTLFPSTQNNWLLVDPRMIMFVRYFRHKKIVYSDIFDKKNFADMLLVDSSGTYRGIILLPTSVDAQGNLINTIPLEIEARSIELSGDNNPEDCGKKVWRIKITFTGSLTVLPSEQCLNNNYTGILLAQSCPPVEAEPCVIPTPPTPTPITRCFTFTGCSNIPVSSISVNGATQLLATTTNVADENDLVAVLNTLYPSAFSVVAPATIQANFAVSQLSYGNAIDAHINELAEVPCP